jgi:N-methylhydantoinase B
MIESDYPIRIERYGFVPDTGGPGRYRGGLGLVREYRMLADDIYFGVRSDKCFYPPHGLFGGQVGAPAVNLIRAAAGDSVLPPMPMERITLHAGDVYRHVMAGGGGYGDPLEREPESVRADVLDDKVTIGHAREAYGVVLGDDAPQSVDVKATQTLRATQRAARAGVAAVAGMPVGPGVATVVGMPGGSGAATAASKPVGPGVADDRRDLP